MLKRIFLLFSFMICLLLSVSCGSDPGSTSTLTTTPTESPLIIPTTTEKEEPTATKEEPTATEEKSTATEEEPTATEEEPTVTEGPTKVAVRESIIVGFKEEPEQVLLGKMLLFALQEAGLEVEMEDQTGYGDTNAIRKALEDGEIDLYWESVLTGLTVIHELSIDALPENRNKWYPLLNGLDKSKQLEWLDPVNLNEEEQMALVVGPLMSERAEVNEVLVDLLAKIGPRLDEQRMGELNDCMKVGADGQAESGDEKSVDEVAKAFLANESLECLPARIVVSSHDIASESVLVGKMLVYLLKDRGYDVVDKTGLGSPAVMREAMLAKKIDLYWEAVSFALTIFHGIEPGAIPTDPTRSFILAETLDNRLGVTWLKRAQYVSSSFMLVVRNETYQQGIRTIEELANFMNANDSPLKICSITTFAQQPDGIPGVEAFYGFKFKPENIVITGNEGGEIFIALRDGGCDVAHALTTDNLDPWGFQALEDNRNFFPPFNTAPVIRQEVLDQYPELGPLIEQVSDFLTDETITELNRLLEVGRDGKPDTGDEESVETIARFALCQANLLKECSSIPPPTLPVPGDCQEVVVNGSFENDGNWGFPGTSSQAGYTSERFHSGEGALRLGIFNPSEDSFSQSVAKQLISIPADAESATLSYWYNPISSDVDGQDVQGSLIFTGDESFVRRKLQGNLSNEQAWKLQTHDLSPFIGEDVVLYFYVDNDGDGQPSGMYLDDVSVQVCTGSQ